MNEWGDKDAEMEGWHHRGHPSGPHRGRVHGMFEGKVKLRQFFVHVMLNGEFILMQITMDVV